jgi:hypothetical protein
MTGVEVLRTVREGPWVEAAAYDKGGWPSDARQVLYARANGAAWALSLAELVPEPVCRDFLVECYKRFELAA